MGHIRQYALPCECGRYDQERGDGEISAIASALHKVDRSLHELAGAADIARILPECAPLRDDTWRIRGLEGALRDAVFAAWDDESASAPPGTGYEIFDTLNRGFGLQAVQLFPALDSVVLYLNERANMAAAMWAYGAIDGVAYAEPDTALGDGSDIEAGKADGRWHVAFAGRGVTVPPAASTRSFRSSPWRIGRPGGSSP